MSEARDGGCLRGRVRFRASGPSKWTIRRHCRSRRKHSGAPAAAFAACDETMVELTGAFDRPETLPPKGELYQEERLPWVCLSAAGEAE